MVVEIPPSDDAVVISILAVSHVLEVAIVHVTVVVCSVVDIVVVGGRVIGILGTMRKKIEII